MLWGANGIDTFAGYHGKDRAVFTVEWATGIASFGNELNANAIDDHNHEDHNHGDNTFDDHHTSSGAFRQWTILSPATMIVLPIFSLIIRL